MLTKIRLSAFLLPVFLVMCLLSGPALAIASGGGVELSLKVRGGLSYLSAGDVNTGSGGFFDYVKLLAANSTGWTTSGDYSPLHLGYDFGADIIIQLSRNIGVGIGAGYLRSSKTSVMTVSTPDGDLKITGTPTLSAIPMRIGVFFIHPLGQRLSFTADAGMTYYAARKFEATLRIDEPAPNYWVTQSISASKSRFSDNLGFQASLGFEYKISQKMGFFLEAAGRFARLKNFKSVTATSASSDSSTETVQGKIYLEKNTYPEGTWTMFVVSSDPPVPDLNTTYSEPKFDLSGFCIQTGIHIRF
jgi:hypothetical protein